MSYWQYKSYVSVATRRANAKTQMNALARQGKKISPIEIEGRNIATTFWGKAWCDHIEALADFESRLPKGRTYVRNGSVCHLEIKQGRVEAYVCGSELYEVAVDIQPLDAERWKQIKQRCAGRIGTALELLQGKFSTEVMGLLTDPNDGMFPSTDDFDLDCSCPDFVRLCKHLAAVLYGVGARLDREPELLFLLRGVDPMELTSTTLDTNALVAGNASAPTIADAELSDVFGIDIDMGAPTPPASIQPVAPVEARSALGKTVGRSSKTRGTAKKKSKPKPAETSTASRGKAKTLRKPARKIKVQKKPAARKNKPS